VARFGGQAARTLAGDVGLMLHVPGLLALTALPVAALAGEWFALPGFAGLAVGALALGQIAVRLAGSASPETPIVALATVALGWLLCAVLAAVPLWAAAQLGGEQAGAGVVYATPVHALFEGMSGFTSTGLTMVGQESQLPRVLQWWRTMLQWVGGVGVVVLVVGAVGSVEQARALYGAEARERVFRDDVKRTAREIWLLFCALTVVAIAALLVAGAGPWVALNHGMTGIATGGFVVTDQSFTEEPVAVKLVALVIMVVGAVSFAREHRLAVARDWRTITRSTQLRALAAGLVGVVALTVVATAAGPEDPGFLDAVFQAVSALATCGFFSESPGGWGPGALLVLVAAMIVGGSAGSTTGGLKLSRAAWLVKAAVAQLSNALRPVGGRARISFDGEDVSAEDAAQAIAYAAALAVLWLATLAIATLALVLMLPESTAHEIAFEATSALGSVGLSTGIAQPTLPVAAEIILIALMWLGRLEIVAVVVLLLAVLAPAVERR
jgi:trk system potassium uptake protein TrkH